MPDDPTIEIDELDFDVTLSELLRFRHRDLAMVFPLGPSAPLPPGVVPGLYRIAVLCLSSWTYFVVRERRLPPAEIDALMAVRCRPCARKHRVIRQHEATAEGYLAPAAFLGAPAWTDLLGEPQPLTSEDNLVRFPVAE